MSHRGITLVELLVSIAIIGVLAALLLPALGSARESSRRAACQNRQRQIGVALSLYHATHEAYPVGCDQWRGFNDQQSRQLAWSAFLLPHLEQAELAARIDYDRPFDDPVNRPAAAVRLPVYICPSGDLTARSETGEPAPSHYGGIYGERITGPNHPPKGVLLIDEPICQTQIDDGLDQTLIVGEDTHFADGQWINGRNLFDQAFRVNAAPRWENDLRSDHPGGALALACSGAVHFFGDQIDPVVLAAWCTRAGGEILGERP